ncbi:MULTISPECIES: dihydrolipoyl dehydrogenase [Prochlorococcus]|uniref:Dihydrolipoyl dehydrogenase n=1 Tax=Prochlorococcus marinus (strain SARG / CCMP1375 / SS120) TaxID=167539 RepID=Q7VAT2_PROMA|nr:MULTISPECIES: dihydrolipoyl dehydrogenase [Prochlorococcus]AAQ00416.1 Dihydrolipoamide dehydrogenase [Prochlorococcus marinus subsp. marinus str. CCMP1375]KGG14298.1 Dihydrolipoamide dehydrogenase of pyruvate dehydrogenase complex [Prochlorococcus marinus str. LG]KGG22129.1 Dihydrolipoamide dehydrogenase of pyruvate dehydrogenase complex [Prochlorococcus marinus str. SS2]KGG24553.1 Dihydrolipoamide dehydrogenase of pyruvate dehydrogenase complex [Prochlorococcus marinus str. SS35]KGG33448.1
MSKTKFDFDLIVIGAGYGGFDAAKHAAENGLKVGIVESRELGGTCVNRGCVPSKALLAASGKVRELANADHLALFGIHAAPVRFERQKIADHANNLVANVRNNLTKTLERAGVIILRGQGRLEGPQRVGVRESSGVDKVLTAKDVILATGSDPFVPPGIETDGRTVFTSDEAISLEWLPRWIAIIGSGYIGLEFADVYTALGCEVTMIEALERVMPTFDPDITKIASRNLIAGRDIDAKSGVLASKVKPGCPVKIELADVNTRVVVEELEVDAVLVATGRVPSSKDLNLESMSVETHKGFIPIDESMRVLVDGKPLPHLWAVGDVTGKLMLAHTAAAQGTVAVDNILGNKRKIDYRSIPAATFTHPEISSVGLSEEQAKEISAKENFSLGIIRSYFKANSKALAELESDGLMKLLFRKDNGQILGAHIYGLHAADLIQEVANALARKQSVVDLALEVHTHPTLSEVVEVAYKQAVQQMKKL